jgi:trimethylamine:corrinoid methyltransferase-like protein
MSRDNYDENAEVEKVMEKLVLILTGLTLVYGAGWIGGYTYWHWS